MSAGLEDELTEDEVFERYRLSRNASCNWGLSTLPATEWDLLLAQFETIGFGLDQYEIHIETLMGIIKDLQSRLEEAKEITEKKDE